MAIHLAEIPERRVDGVDQRVLDAIALMKRDYGGRLTHDNGQTRTQPTWIYSFDRFGDAQLAVRLNKQTLAMYLRATTVDGRELEPLIDGWGVVKDRYPNPKNNPANSLLDERDAHFLSVKRPGNRMLLVELTSRGVKPVLDAYFGLPQANAALPAQAVPPALAGPDAAGPPETSGRRKVLSADELREQLDRRSATGSAGEEIAMQFELQRLRTAGCHAPEGHVVRVSLDDVGRGYDIQSTWPGEERCIEVKSTTRQGSDIFLSANEIEVLEALADKAWLYRVVVDANGGGAVVGSPLQNPVPALRAAGLTAAVWRAADPTR